MPPRTLTPTLLRTRSQTLCQTSAKTLAQTLSQKLSQTFAQTLTQTGWMLLNLPQYARLRRALARPEEAQSRILRSQLRANKDTAFGRTHGFDCIDSPASFRERVPIRGYDDYAPWIERIVGGELRVLTADPVERLVPSSGSSAAAKLIPSTRSFRAEYARAIGAWITDLYLRYPALLRSRAYWAITPSTGFEFERASAVPIGFAEDSSYLGRLGRLQSRCLAVDPAVTRIGDIELFRYVTCLELLRTHDLGLVSVWHPSYLASLLDTLRRHWEPLISDLERGECGGERGSGFARPPDPTRARELSALVEEDGDLVWSRIWPSLRLISCWGDAYAARPLAELARGFPSVELQPKGLLSTEACISIPFQGQHPLAVHTHFYEFVDGGGRAYFAHELEADREYSVVVTTSGGLYRYALRDRVRVSGFLAKTPCLAFVGKEDRVSDRFGEKLDEAFVSSVLRAALREVPEVRFAMLAPDLTQGCARYTLYLEATLTDVAALERRVDQELRTNPHYDYCRRLGQLDRVSVFRVRAHAIESYVEACLHAGQRLGDIKPVALSPRDAWSACFDGAYAIPATLSETEPGMGRRV